MALTSNAIILNVCQDLTKHSLRTGAPFTLSVSIWDGISYRYSSPGIRPSNPDSWTRTSPPTSGSFFPNAGPNSLQEPTQKWPTTFRKHKTPSQRRRDQRRWDAYEPKKPTVAGPPDSSANSMDTPPTVEPLEDVDLPPTENLPPTVDLPPTEDLLPTEDLPPTVVLPPIVDLPPIVESIEPPTTTQTTQAVDFPQIDEPPTSAQSQMEVDPFPPLMISPMTSPVKTLDPKVKTLDPKLPQELVVVIQSDRETSKSAIISLRRTLKKCNLKSINPEHLEAYNEHGLRGAFIFKLDVPTSRFEHLKQKLMKNWISFDEASINRFYIKQHEKFI